MKYRTAKRPSRTRWQRLVRWVAKWFAGNPRSARGWDDYAPTMARTLEDFNRGHR